MREGGREGLASRRLMDSLGWMDGWMDGWVDGWVGGWMEGGWVAKGGGRAGRGGR